MKICFGCRKATYGNALYCQYCGKTYGVRLCGRGHINPRSANVCSTCGSHELSTPEPKIPLLLKPLLFLLKHISGIVLVLLLIGFGGFFVRKLITDPSCLLPLMLLGFLLGLLLLFWMILPTFIRKPISKMLWRRKEKH